MALSSVIRSRLETQGFVGLTDTTLAEVEPWLRLSPALCTVLVGVGTVLPSPTMLWVMAAIAVMGALLPFHPFDGIYNFAIRFLMRMGPLPHNSAPRRFACGLAAAWLAATALAFESGAMTLGYILGGVLTAVGALVATTHFCIPSTLYCAIFGQPTKRRG